MKKYYKLTHRLIACTLLLSLFLQSCGGFSNQVIPQEKKQPSKSLELSNHSLINTDKKIVTSGGYLASFYEKDGELKADLKADEKQPEPNYKGILVVVEECTDLSSLTELDHKTQQNRIQLRRKNERIDRMIILNGGVAGGVRKKDKKYKSNNSSGQSSSSREDNEGSDSVKGEDEISSSTNSESEGADKGGSSDNEWYDNSISKNEVKRGGSKKSKKGTNDSNKIQSESRLTKKNNNSDEKKGKEKVKGDEEEGENSIQVSAFSLKTKQFESVNVFLNTSNSRLQEEYSEDSGDESDDAGNRVPYYADVYNFTRKQDGFIDNYFTVSNPNPSPSLWDEIKDKLNSKACSILGSLTDTTILCVLLIQNDGRIKKFVFTSNPSVLEDIKSKAHEGKYHIIKTQQSHAEGGLIQFLRQRPKRYTHIIAMGCNNSHCDMCKGMMKNIFGNAGMLLSNSDNWNQDYTTDNWYMPPALIEALQYNKYDCNQLRTCLAICNKSRSYARKSKIATEKDCWKSDSHYYKEISYKSRELDKAEINLEEKGESKKKDEGSTSENSKEKVLEVKKEKKKESLAIKKTISALATRGTTGTIKAKKVDLNDQTTAEKNRAGKGTKENKKRKSKNPKDSISSKKKGKEKDK